jgi:hypothetical protein
LPRQGREYYHINYSCLGEILGILLHRSRRLAIYLHLIEY